MENNKITKNIIISIIQAVISGITLFYSFHYLLNTIGAEEIGIWSIVLAVLSIVRISELGLSGSTVKFTAKHLSLGHEKAATEVIQTAAITVGLATAILLLSSSQLTKWVLIQIIGNENRRLSDYILPYASLSIWLGAVTGIFLAGLEGCQNFKVRSLITIGTSIIFMALVYLLVPLYGIDGLVLAQIIQNITGCFSAWFFLRKELPSMRSIKMKWKLSVLRQMMHYGINFQTISLLSMLLDPITKAIMTKFGGLASVTFYEMSNRLVTQFRIIIVSANQVMVSKIAELHQSSPEKIKQIYIKSYKIVFFLSIPLYAGLIATAPLVCELWIGRYDTQFVYFLIMISGGFWINTITVPAYFYFMGIGELKWNKFSQITIIGFNLIFSTFLGIHFGAFGVALGYSISIAIGSVIIIYGYSRENNFETPSIVPNESRKILFSTIGALVMSGIAFSNEQSHFSPIFRSLIPIVIVSGFMLPYLLRHPEGIDISHRIHSILKNIFSNLLRK